MLKLCRVTKLKVFFPVLVYAFNFDLFEFSAAILEKGLFAKIQKISYFLFQKIHTISFINSGDFHDESRVRPCD